MLTVSGLTALKAMRDVGRVQPGQSVLINGASGGVGVYAVQIATALGGDVTGVNLGFAYNLIVNVADDGLADVFRRQAE